MKITMKTSIVLVLCFTFQMANAQDSLSVMTKQQKIEALTKEKQTIESQERELLKRDLETIESRLKKGEISQEECDRLKLEAAKIRAANIDNKKVIIDNRIALVEREDAAVIVSIADKTIDIEKQTESNQNTYSQPKSTDWVRKTYSGLLFAVGFNNTIIEGQNIDDSPYKIGGSGFVELGTTLNTPITMSSNFLTLKYGLSFQWNKLNIKDNMYIVEDQATHLVTLHEHPETLKEAKFRVVNMVVPVHLEFGSTGSMVTKNGVSYRRGGSFKLGLGGYAGVRLASVQKLEFEETSEFRGKKQKIKDDYNTSNFAYGFSAYVGFDGYSLYAKYDMSPLFKNQPVAQNNISVGLRVDFD